MNKFYEYLEIFLYETISKLEDMHIYVVKKINNDKND